MKLIGKLISSIHASKLEDNITNVIVYLTDKRNESEKLGYENIHLCMDGMDDGGVEISLYGDTEETSEQILAREKREEECGIRNLQYERQQYEKLKKKFEPQV